MDNKQRAFLKLLENTISDRKQVIDDNLLDDIIKMSCSHLCIPFIYLGLTKAGMDSRDLIDNLTLQIVSSNYKNLSVQDKIINTLKLYNIKCVILKGSSVAVNYEQPIYRQLGDIDVLVEENKYENVINILTGSANRDKRSLRHKFHYSFNMNGVTVEVHKKVTDFTGQKFSTELEKFMDRAIENSIQGAYDCFEFPMLDIEWQAISLVLHTYRHFINNKLSMRMLCDWAVFIQMIFRNNELQRINTVIETFGLKVFADALTAVSIRYLGIEYRADSLTDFDDSFLETFILEFLDNGVIDNENSTEKNVANLYALNKTNSNTNLTAIIKTINQINVAKYNISGTKKLLLPILGVISIVNYLIKSLKKKNNKNRSSDFETKLKRREEMYRVIENGTHKEY